MESFDICHHLWLSVLDALSNLVDVLKELWKLRQHFKERLYDDDSELLPSTISSESLYDKFESDVLQNSVQKVVFDNGAEELGNLCEILLGVPVQKSILIEETM